jgi:hypothetical protein
MNNVSTKKVKATLLLLAMVLGFTITLPQKIFGQQIFNLHAGAGSSGVDPINNNVLATTVNLNNAVFVMETDASNNVYFSLSFASSPNRNFVKKVDASGIMTNVAGTGTIGYSGDNGLAVNAEVFKPGAIAVDGSGNLYFTDQNGSVVRRVDGTSGIITTVFSITSGQLGSLALAPNGDLYMGYEAGAIIQRLDLNTSIATTIAGNGTVSSTGDGGLATAATIIRARDMAVDGSGNLYFSQDDGRVRRIDATTGIITTVVGGGSTLSLTDGIPATSLGPNVSQNGIAVYANELYFSTYTQGVWRVDGSGNIQKAVNHYGSDLGQDIDIDASGTVYSALATGSFYGGILKSGPCVPASIPTLSATSSTVCVGQGTTLSISSGLLNNSTDWQWYSNSCGGTLIGTGTTITDTPSTTTTYYARGEGECSLPGACESITITVDPGFSVANISACDTYTWAVNGSTYTASGTYTYMGTSSAGCPQFDTLHLTIYNPIYSFDTVTACDNYTWPANGQQYNASGIYTHTINPPSASGYCFAGANTDGCSTGDEYISNVSIGSINNSSACGVVMYENYTTLTTPVVVGSSYPISVTNLNTFIGDQVTVWVDWNQNGSFSDVGEETALIYTPNLGSGTITVPANAFNGNTTMRVRLNFTGTMDPCGFTNYGEVEDYTLTVSGGITSTPCPQYATLNLTINNSTSNTTAVAACDSYTWSLNNTTYSNSGMYTSTSTNAAGCIHSEILNLTINTFNTGSPTPELLYYKFDGTGTSVPNLALTPPSGTANATILGTISQGSTGQSGGALIGSGISSTTNYLNTGWAPNLGGGSWTISFWSEGIHTQANILYYAFGDVNTASLRCFTNGVAGPNNWLLRGAGLIDVLLPGGAQPTPTVNTFVYDATLNNVKAYLNGVLVNTVAQSAPNLTGAGPLKVMGYASNIGAPVGGKLDEFRLYNRALAATEVLGLNGAGGALNATATPSTICAGDNTVLSITGGSNVVSYTWNPGNTTGTSIVETPSSTTEYTVTATDNNGCNGTTTALVTVNQPTSNTTTATACGSYTWSVDGMTYTSSGTYTQVSTNANGCTHTEILNLTINNSTSNTTSATACDSYTWSVDGMTYNASGTYTFVTTISVGCTHTEILNLTINNSSSNTTTVTACDSYTWSVDGMTYNASGTYTFVTTISVGCTHTEILNLTINNSSSNNTNAAACGSYTWAADGMTYTTSGNYTHVSTNANGCVHTETLNLTINTLPVVTAPNVSACPGSTLVLGGSPSGGFWNLPNPYTGSATSYTYTYTDGNGCSASATASINTTAVAVSVSSITNLTGISATVNYTSVNGIGWYEIRWKPVSSSTWIVGTNSNATSKQLISLTPNTMYEVQVRGYCSTASPGSWSASTLFLTPNTCTVPTGLFANNVAGSTAKLNWTSVPGASFYTVRWKAVSSSTWSSSTTTTNSKVIAGLTPNTNYEFQIRTHCGSSAGAYSGSGLFTTAGSKGVTPIEEENITKTVQVYPNPTQDVLHIDFSAIEAGELSIKVMDMSARIVKQSQATAEVGMNNMTLNLGDLSNGIYTIQIIQNNKLSSVHRVIKN